MAATPGLRRVAFRFLTAAAVAMAATACGTRDGLPTGSELRTPEPPVGTVESSAPAATEPSLAPAGARLLRVAPGSGEVSATELPDGTRMLAAAGGRIWLTDGAGRGLVMVEPRTRTATVVDVREPAGLTGDGPDLWVSAEGSSLIRLDGANGERRQALQLSDAAIFARGDAGHIAVGGGYLWLTVPVLGQPRADQTLWKIDPANGTVADRWPIGVNPIQPLAREPFVWVITRSGSGQLTRLDMSSGAATSVRGVAFAERMAACGGRIWIGSVGRSLAWFDPATARLLSSIDLDGPARGIACVDVDRLDVWVATDASVSRVDGEGTMTAIADLRASTSGTSQNWGLVAEAGSLWVLAD